MFWTEKKEEDIIAKQRDHENKAKVEKEGKIKTQKYKKIATFLISILAIVAATSFLFWVDDVSKKEESKSDYNQIIYQATSENEAEYFRPTSDSYTNDYYIAAGKIPSPLTIPESGQIYAGNIENGDAPFTIETKGDKNYFVKLKEYGTGEDVLSVFVRGGETANVDVPFGNYDLYYATGEEWYGTDLLFWEDTQCYKAEETFEFYEDSGYVNGWTVELYLQNNGNLSTAPIEQDDF